MKISTASEHLLSGQANQHKKCALIKNPMIVYDHSDIDVEGSITLPQCFQYMGKDRTKFGVVEVCIDSAIGVLVDGRELLEHELKVKVI